MEAVLLMHRAGHIYHCEGAIHLKSRWLYRFVLQYVGPGTLRNGLLAHRGDRVYGGMSSEKWSDS